MTERSRALLEDVLRLSGSEREELVEALLDAIEAEDFALTSEQEAEIARRVRDVREGRNVGRDLGVVLDELEVRARRTA